MIKKFSKLVKKTIDKVKPLIKLTEKDIECAIDDQIVECKELDEQPYTGIPAPIVNAADEWFSSPYGFAETVFTEKQKNYIEQETNFKMEEQKSLEKSGQEPEDIHQAMYEIATRTWGSVKETQGGSENFQQNPSDWMSGTGYGQFTNDKK